jgi:hypothetical protein
LMTNRVLLCLLLLLGGVGLPTSLLVPVSAAGAVSGDGQGGATEPPIITLTPTLTTTPTETATPPTETATPTATPTLAVERDNCEPNDSFDQPCPIFLNQTVANLTLSPVGDQDYFAVYLKAGQSARAATFPLPGSGTDTRLFVYSGGGALLGENEDRSPTDLGSTVSWTAAADGFYILRVESAIPFPGRYDLLVSLEAPAATATPMPTATPQPTLTPLVPPDMAEPNNRPEEAYEIVAGATYNLTLGPRGVDDHDFFKLWVKAGNPYRCAARPTGPVDPALRVYAGDIGGGTLLAENDDISPTDIGSLVTFVAPYTGFLFVVAEAQAGYGAYTLLCEAYVPPAPVSASSGGISGAAPSPTPAATITTTANVAVEIRPLPPLAPTATPATATTIRVQVIYDLNANGQPDPDEGVPNVSVRAVSRNAIVGWALTDERGVATLTILGDVDRVIVPFLSGWSRPVRLGQLNEAVLSAPAVSLPVIMPVVGDE